jgi:hypothetical protein
MWGCAHTVIGVSCVHMTTKTIENFADWAAKLRELILQRIAAEQYPASYTELVDAQARDGAGKNAKIWIMPDEASCETLELDWTSELMRGSGVTAVFCPGGLSIKGDLLNVNPSSGPFVFVAGDLTALNVVAGGGRILVLGNVHADGIVVGNGNDGVLKVAGNLKAQAVINLDHDIGVDGTIDAPYIDWNEDSLPDRLVAEVFHDDDPSEVEVEKLLSLQRSGLPILLDD